MFWQVANSFFNDGPGWQAVKKWYASRLEFSGLALVAGLIILNEQMPAPLYVKGIITSGTFATLICNLISLYLYAVVDISEKTMDRIIAEAANFGFPYSKLPLRDRYYGRFCRMVSATFLSWSAFFKQRRIGSIMIGSIQASLGQESKCPAVALLLYFWLGWFFMRKHMRMETDTDPLASPEFKKALKEAMERVEQGLSAAPDELPPVSTKSLGPGVPNRVNRA
ncbi:unnamed protein product [Heligmosomoides polygyrus]|uniref:ADP,ATP carrier protein n=1 Tax=Heligmosomoides polygyrus TaxID=6339 RepID=A0A183GT04_HELPZ|nr:unnamed protein product [Heligmosomoides polygyrus]